MTRCARCNHQRGDHDGAECHGYPPGSFKCTCPGFVEPTANPLPRVWCPTCKRMVNAHEVRADGHHEKLVFDKPLHGGIGGRWVVCKEPTLPEEPT